MAESRKGTSSTVDSRKKNSPLDEELGNEFLNSWKSITLTEDDKMDFNFDTVTKGNNKAFDFGKLDMDFNLDGGFDKKSSFNVDMSDLDFSSPPKKSTESGKRDKCKESHQGKKDLSSFKVDMSDLDFSSPPKKSTESGKKDNCKESHQGKKDSSIFSFYFNELDDFDFDKNLVEGQKNSSWNLDKGESASNKNECQDSKIHTVKGIRVFNDDTTKEFPLSKSLPSSESETFLGGRGVVESENAECASPDAETFNKKTSEEERDETCISPETDISMDGHQSKYDVPAPERKESNNITVSALQREVFSLGAKEADTASGLKGNVKNKVTESDGCFPKNLLSKTSSLLPISISKSNHSERNRSSGCNPTENVDTELAKGDLEPGVNSSIDISTQIPQDVKDVRDNQKPSSKLPPVKMGRENSVEEVTLKETTERSDLSGRQSYQSSSTGTSFKSFETKRAEAMFRSSASEKGEGIGGNDEPKGCKLVGNSVFAARESKENKSSIFGSGKSLKNVSNISVNWENFKFVTVPNCQKVVGKSQLLEKEVTKGETASVGCGNSFTDLAVLSRNLNTSSDPGNKLRTLKPALKMPNFSSKDVFMEQRSKILTNSKGLKEKNFRDLHQSGEVQRGTAALGTSNYESSQKHKLIASSLKRKSSEASNPDSVFLKPLKRLSGSSAEGEWHRTIDHRNSKEQMEKLIEEQVESDVKSACNDHSTPSVPTPHAVNMLELDIPMILEKDHYVEKAEEYMKELDNICNMLKKKQEEAKELLVRALVNNNCLLLLNHPLYPDKIKKVQKFAAEMMSKELCT